MTPKADKSGLIGQGVPFERIRRITGYLAGTVDRFNNAKRAEVRDRVKHEQFVKFLVLLIVRLIHAVSFGEDRLDEIA